jgi:hypothetical protein
MPTGSATETNTGSATETNTGSATETNTGSATETNTGSDLGSDTKTDSEEDTGADACPDDPNKTEPGVCGCGVKEGSCICVVVAENEIATLKCPNKKLIKRICFAGYGSLTGSCETGFTLGACFSTSTETKVETACLKKNSCNVTASNANFGDPCSGQPKRLAIVYTCG